MGQEGQEVIASRDWESVLEAYQASSPYNYAVMDDFLNPVICQKLHQELLDHQGWCLQKSTEQPLLSNMEPDIQTIFAIAEAIKDSLPVVFSNYDLVEHWALMYPNNSSGKIHSDIGSVTVNIWLTPEEYNLDPSNGGLIFFDVKRGCDRSDDASLTYLWSEEYFKKHTKCEPAIVNYRYNRALLFDARTFHKTDIFNFVNTQKESYRINLSLAFENRKIYQERTLAFRKAITSANDQ
ncbi:hypothetical protein [Roseofilum capinflatum]|uniref:Prolyl 4-hydroxylase alpha subunit Fe(2+) 2OG dioxygenase domain-containing protein n=1 Tax=Roseofilum capinflatum BLCC-M114 TaxID=3022440 RepID=A0ABT7B596_9CYAN|nr:hypothetical protein [Roseofilum capinflatum]MDJ1174290.1 hypothetical protein [Roseofilum capinflatum BLCC-M114]